MRPTGEVCERFWVELVVFCFLFFVFLFFIFCFLFFVFVLKKELPMPN